MRTLIPHLQHYAWGATDSIPAFLGTPPDGRPVAEAWFGAHPSGPAQTEFGRDLGAYIAEAPHSRLGEDVVARFGTDLPYLLKLIAPARPLSLQVHPNLHQARAGHEREQARGVPAAQRNYPDANHKPELVYALTTFEAVSGFRAPRRAAELLSGLQASLARDLRQDLRTQPGASGVQAAFTRLLHASDRAGVDAVVAECDRRLRTQASPSPRADEIVVRLGTAYPGDPGAVAALLLNPVTLQPGEVMFIPAGCVHAYLSGFGIEVMANSNNVLRAGLTHKHVDVEELLATVDCLAAPPLRIAAEMLDDATGVFYAPVDDFELSVCRLQQDPGRQLRGRGPRVLVAAEGTVSVATDAERRTLQRGDSLFAAADEGAVRVAGTGVLVQADVP